MFGPSYRIATVWGIPIRVHLSAILLLMFFVPSLGWFDGTLLVIMGLTSIALHELGHSFIAQKRGCRVQDIILSVIGGMARMQRIPHRPKHEIQMALAGPAVSAIIGVTCLLAGPYLPLQQFKIAGDPPAIMNVVGLVGVLNLAWVVFNLIPAFPMDGGRVLRAGLTPKFGRVRATEIAATLGKVFAVLFGVFGLVNARWTLLLIAVFIYMAAGQEYRMVRMEDMMKRNPFGSFFGGNNPFSHLYKEWNNRPRTQDEWTDDDGEEDVTISPPPYRNGPATHTDIQREDDSFRRF